MPDDDFENFEADHKKRQERILRSHLAQLCEHFDSVQIVATDYCPQTGTGVHSFGEGNYYARLGATEEWVRSCKRK